MTLTAPRSDFIVMTFIVASLHGNQKSALFTQEGMAGVQRKNPDLPVSLMSLTARKSVDRARERGLCFVRFTADITLNCEQMPATGTLLKCGDLVLEILPERKTCWPECVLVQNERPCPLKDGVRFARVVVPGALHLDTKIEIVNMKTHTRMSKSS